MLAISHGVELDVANANDQPRCMRDSFSVPVIDGHAVANEIGLAGHHTKPRPDAEPFADEVSFAGQHTHPGPVAEPVHDRQYGANVFADANLESDAVAQCNGHANYHAVAH